MPVQMGFHLRMLFAIDIGRIFPLLRHAMHHVHYHTLLPSTSNSGERGQAVDTQYRSDSMQGLHSGLVYTGSSYGVCDVITAEADVAWMFTIFLSEFLEIPSDQRSLLYLVLR